MYLQCFESWENQLFFLHLALWNTRVQIYYFGYIVWKNVKDPVYNNLSHELETRLTNTTTVDRLVDGDNAIPNTTYKICTKVHMKNQ